MENYTETIEKASKTKAVLGCIIILLVIAMLISFAGDKSAIASVLELFN
ncbi:MAG: hypothetical protein ACJ77K_03210 [Bacteroidia bacterium]